MALALHVALVGGIVYFTMQEEQHVEDQIEPALISFEKVELLALGEEKPPEALPRIANPEPEVQPPDTVNLQQPEKPVVELEKKEEKEKKEDDEARKKKMLDALSALHNPNRPTNEDIPEGVEDGIVGGDVTDAALANMMKTYVAKLLREISRVWEVPSTIPLEEIQNLAGQVTVYLRVSEDGHVVSYKFETESSNAQFNASIDRVIRRFQVMAGRKLPLPDDPAVRDAVIRQGLRLRNWEYRGR